MTDLPRSNTRDPRLDLLRGVALCFMLVDHIEAVLDVRLVREYTPAAWLWFDSADIFVFISGLAVGVSFWRRLERDGYWPCQRHALSRAAVLYAVNLSLLLFVLAFTALASCTTAASFKKCQFTTLPHGRIETVLCVLGMMYNPIGFDILVLYIQLVLFAPMALWLWRESRAVSMLLILNIYCLGKYWPEINFPEWPFELTTKRCFNHFAWHALFLSGLYLGAAKDSWDLSSAVWKVPRRFALGLSAMLVLSLLFLRWLAPTGALLYLRHEWAGKYTLGTLRIVEFAAWMNTLRLLVSPGAVNHYRHWLYPFLACGRRSLVCFSAAQILTYCSDLYAITVGRSCWQLLAWDAIALGVLLTIGACLDRVASRGLERNCSGAESRNRSGGDNPVESGGIQCTATDVGVL